MNQAVRQWINQVGSPHMFPSLSIVMAAFNEEEALPACVERTLTFLRTHVEDGELVIVNDGSTDGTPEVLDALAEANPEIVARHLLHNSGMGAALIDGYRVAGKTWIAMMPSDGQIDPYDFLDFFDVTESADVVTSLYRNREYTFGRKVLSYGLRVLTATIVGTRARTEGSYMVRRDVLNGLGASSHSFLLNLEIPIRAKRRGFRVETVFMNVHERIAGESKAVNFGRIRQTFGELFRLRLKMREEERASRR